MNTYQRGFSVVEGLLILVIIGIIGGVGWFVYDSNNKTRDPLNKVETTLPDEQVTKSEEKKAPTNNQNFIVINEMGIKIPLTDITKGATYKMENGGAALMVKIPGDDGSCDNQAIIAKLSSDEIAEHPVYSMTDIVAYGTKIGDSYYMMVPPQYICTENKAIYSKASSIRGEWLKQGKYIQPI